MRDLRLTMVFESLRTGEKIIRCLDIDSRESDIGLKIEKPFISSFDGMLETMKARERRAQIIDNFSRSFVDYLNDRDGWHGEQRRITIDEVERNFRRAKDAGLTVIEVEE